MLILYDNAFSPFARKVRMVLRFKGLKYESIDALALAEHDRLLEVNPRAEVPALVDGDAVVTDSVDIVYYLEDRYPEPPVFPVSAVQRAKARHWQRQADTLLDAIIHDISIWTWPTLRRPDRPPEGLLETGRGELHGIMRELEATLDASGYVCDRLSIADFALFPHLSALKVLGITLDEENYPGLLNWNRQMRRHSVVSDDLALMKQSAVEKFGAGRSPYETQKIVWRGDRIEWLLANGFQDWFISELKQGRAVFPGWQPDKGEAG